MLHLFVLKVIGQQPSLAQYKRTPGIKQEIIMNKTGIISGAALLLAASSAQSVTIMDNYIGANHHGYGDVIGNTSNFQINFMEVEINGTILTVSIDTTFAGKGDNGLFRGLTYDVTVPDSITFGQSAAAGDTATAARRNHSHGMQLACVTGTYTGDGATSQAVTAGKFLWTLSPVSSSRTV